MEKVCIYLPKGAQSTGGKWRLPHSPPTGFTASHWRALLSFAHTHGLPALSHRHLTGPEVASMQSDSCRPIHHPLRWDDQFVATVRYHRRLTGTEAAWKPCCSRSRFYGFGRSNGEFVAAVDCVVTFWKLQQYLKQHSKLGCNESVYRSTHSCDR